MNIPVLPETFLHPEKAEGDIGISFCANKRILEKWLISDRYFAMYAQKTESFCGKIFLRGEKQIFISH